MLSSIRAHAPPCSTSSQFATRWLKANDSKLTKADRRNLIEGISSFLWSVILFAIDFPHAATPDGSAQCTFRERLIIIFFSVSRKKCKLNPATRCNAIPNEKSPYKIWPPIRMPATYTILRPDVCIQYKHV